jgi:hypothetical protein
LILSFKLGHASAAESHVVLFHSQDRKVYLKRASTYSSFYCNYWKQELSAVKTWWLKLFLLPAQNESFNINHTILHQQWLNFIYRLHISKWTFWIQFIYTLLINCIKIYLWCVVTRTNGDKHSCGVLGIQVYGGQMRLW